MSMGCTHFFPHACVFLRLLFSYMVAVKFSIHVPLPQVVVISCVPPHFPQVDFQDVEARTLAERRRREEKQQRLERIYKGKLEKAKQEMEGKLVFTVLLV